MTGRTEPTPAIERHDYALVITGGELLKGTYPDGHTHFLTRTLRPLGFRCVGSVTVDDRAEDLRRGLRFAAGNAPLVIVTGGLGPTDDDVTRETLSAFTGIPLREEPALVAAMERSRPDRPSSQLPDNLRRQARVPAKGTYLANPNGTAVGLVFESDSHTIIALPGPPRELRPMVTRELIPFLSGKLGVKPIECSILLRFAAIGESTIDQTLKQHVKIPEGAVVSSQFDDGRVDLTFTMNRDTAGNQERLDRLKEDIRKHLGANIYADDESTLEDVVMERIEAQNLTVTIAEIGTGGAVVSALNRTHPRARLRGWVAESESALCDLLRMAPPDPSEGSDPATFVSRTARALWDRSRGSANLVIGEIRSDANGTPTVWIAFVSAGGIPEIRSLPAASTTASARAGLVSDILLTVKAGLDASRNEP